MNTITRESNGLLFRAGAEFSDCEQYRFRLWRIWDEDKPSCAFIGLNPSTADEKHLDPTMRRCIRFAQDWGFGGFQMLNLFAFRATDPVDMYAAEDPVGNPTNDARIVEVTQAVSLVIAAWGNHGTHLDRWKTVAALVPNLHTLLITGANQPGHPLYLPAHTKPQPWQPQL